jgi:membrane protease YdiL (CAAX protease family)
MAPRAAWYPDPSGVGELRYWDGSAWTPGVVVDGKVTERPMPWPPVGPPRHHQVDAEPDDRADLPGRAALYGLAGFVGGAAVGLLLGFAAAQAGVADAGILLLNLIGLWGGMLGACWRVSRRWGSGNLRRDFGLAVEPRDVGRGVVMSLAARLAAAAALLPLVYWSERFAGSNSGVYGEVTDSGAGFAVFAVVAVLGAPLVEELFFRGLLLRSLTSAVGATPALVLQALLFGLAHGSPLLGLLNVSVIAATAAAGLVFGATARRRGVGTSAVAHGAFNLFSVVVAAFVLF